jgi:hypothetical protein
MKIIGTIIFGLSLSTTALVAAPSDKECKADFEKLCEGVEFSKKNILTCLVDKRSEVSSKCNEYIASVNPLGSKTGETENKKGGVTDAAKDKKKKLTDKKKSVTKEGSDLMKAITK